MITQTRLKEVIFYNPILGTFCWNETKNNNGAHRGDAAGFISNGYLRIGIDGDEYAAHRLAWLYCHGFFPENDIDHIDRNPLNNSLHNLRETSRICNMRNTGLVCTNTSGVKGVTFDTERNSWVAQIVVNYKNKFLGRYDDFDDAVCARYAAEQCLAWNRCDKESSAYQYIMKWRRLDAH